MPSLMEIMDRTSIEAVEQHLKTELGAGTGCAALLICQSDSGGEPARHELPAIEQVCARGATSSTPRTTRPRAATC